MEVHELPRLRPDIEFLPSTVDSGGAPVYMIYDRLAGTFDQVDYWQMEVLKRLHHFELVEDLHLALGQQTTLRVTREQLVMFITGIVERGLTRVTAVKPVEQLMNEKAMRKRSLIKTLIHHYLYFRIPLIKPDDFLTKTLPFAKKFVSPLFIVLYAVAVLIGCYTLLMRWDEYVHTFMRFFSFEGMIIYGAAIVAVKLLHEFSHVYVAKSFGVRVPTMGVAFMVLWPVAYSDVTDAWRLRDRRKRLLISSAGILIEVVIAVVCLSAWAFAPVGIWQSIFFVLSSVSLIGTIMVNLNPVMRFDGYYLLSDLLKIDNLQQRAFGFTRWLYRLRLFGLEAVCPEVKFTDRQCVYAVVYSISTWIYRFFLYLGIAVMVYYKFTKILGIILFSIELVMFLIMPLWKEIVFVSKAKKNITRPVRLIATLSVLSVVILGFVVPLPATLGVAAVAVPSNKQHITAPVSGVVGKIDFKRAMFVKQNQFLVEVSNPQLLLELEVIEKQIDRAQNSIDEALAGDKMKSQLNVLREEYRRLEARKAHTVQVLGQNQITADFDGVVGFKAEGLVQGAVVRQRDQLGGISGPVDRVHGYVSQKDIFNLNKEGVVWFYPHSGEDRIQGVVLEISEVPEEVLEDQQLSVNYGGHIPVTNRDGISFVMVDKFYKITIKIDGTFELRSGQTGVLNVSTRRHSRLLAFVKKAWKTIIEETNF